MRTSARSQPETAVPASQSGTIPRIAFATPQAPYRITYRPVGWWPTGRQEPERGMLDQRPAGVQGFDRDTTVCNTLIASPFIGG